MFSNQTLYNDARKYNGIIASVSQTCSLIDKELAKLAEMALDLSAEFRQTIGFLTKCLNSFSIFWKDCMNSDEISKFRQFVTDNSGQIV